MKRKNKEGDTHFNVNNFMFEIKIEDNEVTYKEN